MVQRIWNIFFNRENVSYLVFGVLTTLADWISYRMMRLAGMPVAVGNAKEEVKAIAKYVTTSNHEDGVAQAVRKFVL